MSAIIAPLNPSTGGVTDPLSIGSVFATSAIRNSGIEYIFSDTKPTTRKNGDALVAKDLWYKSAESSLLGSIGEYYWTGTDWVSTTLQRLGVGTTINTNISASTNLGVNGGSEFIAHVGKILVTHGEFVTRIAATISSGNDFAVRAALYDGITPFYDVFPSFSLLSSGYTVLNTKYRLAASRNAIVDFASTNNAPNLILNLTRTGTASAAFWVNMYYREVHP